MLFLITGKPGSFKTAKTATLALQYLKEGRSVYTNIDEFDYEGVQKLPENNDWRETPEGSVVIYDEAQQFDFLQYKGREKLSSDGRVKELEVHRHTGHDIILVTQSPTFLHNHVLSLVGSHYHLHRAYGRGFADVFLWRYAVTMPDSTGAKNKAESHEKFKPDSKIFDKYKSTTLDTHKLKIPPLYYKLGGFLILVLAIIGYVVFGSSNPYISVKAILGNKDKLAHQDEILKNGKSQQVLSSSPAATTTTNQQSTDLDLQCRKAENLNKPECVKWYDDLTKNKNSVAVRNESGSFSNGSNSVGSADITYDPAKPYASKLENVHYTVSSMPKFSGCLKTQTGEYRAYTEQGTYLKTSKSVCDRLMHDSADRPYDYFRQQNQQQLQAQQLSDIKSSSNKDDSKQSDSNVVLVPDNSVFPPKDITKPTI
ncbi:zonular occludens toxin domain-containing protein [Acinetobacter sp. ANC 4641]|uniref:zonular occludens toxin domain-containing protein n=1 Tax=Acinetobacter sp. ANC 4641 TaxID=2529847 RepID=UPI001038B537|nr:zonular occludens toxin domain-containing protein [Acinetobacter sp. ANC 4641]TCB11523.1 hypothetical protein E0H78_07815 [Acinetobacter sp. ANC 4641]